MPTIEELDEAWSKDRRQFMIKGRFGHTIPSSFRGVLYIGVGVFFSFMALFLIFWIYLEKTLVAVLTFFGIAGLSTAYFFFARHEFRQVPLYQKAHAEYLQARDRLPNPGGKPPLK